MSMQVTCPWASRLGSKTIQPGVSSPFGTHNESASFSLTFDNRVPNLNSMDWRHVDGTAGTPFMILPTGSGITPTFVSDLTISTNPIYRRQYLDNVDYTDLHQTCGNFIDYPNGPFGVYLDAVDPDGDPVSAELDIICGANDVRVLKATFSQPGMCNGYVYEPATKALIPANNTFPFRIIARPAQYGIDCNPADGVADSYQDLRPNLFEFNRAWIRCTLDGPDSYITDDFSASTTPLATSTRNFALDADTGNNCYQR